MAVFFILTPICQVLTIAHRLDTIIDYDRVLVLSDGRIAEDDHPQALLDEEKYPEGVFKAMWEAHQAGVL
jgi:ABC-type multidrug transport system fused ATPase/permease subunit